jgi:hypothetical protein
MSVLYMPAGIIGVLVLVGGVLLRYSTIKAGIYLPLYRFESCTAGTVRR